MSTTKSIKRKRISKKNKSAWRKTDINDVENFLEAQRQEERIGSVAEKKDEELFTVDVVPQNKISKRHASQLTQKQKRKLNAAKPLRTHAVFENTSKVQDPIIKRNKVKQKKSGRNIEEEVRNPTKPRHFIANKDRAVYYKKLDQRGKKLQKLPKDIWAVEDFRDEIPGLKDEKGWISRDLALYQAKNIGKPVIKVHDSIRHRTTKAKNFEIPHPGLSYNPDLKDHQALLTDVVEREKKIIKEEEHLKRVTTAVFKKVTPEQRDLLRFKEMSGDVIPNVINNKKKQKSKIKNKQNNDNDSASDDSDGDGDEIDEVGDDDEVEAPYKSVNPPVENKKKTKQMRNKQLKQKELEKKQEVKKVLKKQIADIHRIKSIKNEVIASENELNELKKRRKKTALKKKFEPKRLGRLKYEEPEIDVNMPEDIANNVRNIKTESSLLIDRFNNFQKRNMLAKSVALRRPKKPIKRFVRSSHKEPGVSFDSLRRVRKTQKQNQKIIK